MKFYALMKEHEEDLARLIVSIAHTSWKSCFVTIRALYRHLRMENRSKKLKESKRTARHSLRYVSNAARQELELLIYI